jgi:hypothetical protein
MKNALFLGMVCTFCLSGCQSERTSVEGRQGNTQVTVSVGQTSTPVASIPDAPSVTVGGSGVKIDAPGARVQVGAGGIQMDAGGASLQVNGVSNSQSENDSLSIAGVSDTKTYAVENKDVDISGTNHNLKLTGKVKQLELAGSDNVVEVEEVSSVSVSGTNNRVVYGGNKPEIQLSGLGNQCEARP